MVFALCCSSARRRAFACHHKGERTFSAFAYDIEETMPNIPDDVFTEPDNVSPDTLANLGPLRRLAGVWQSDEGVDINPKAEGPERRVFREHIRMEPIDPQANGPQLLYGLRYHIHINTPEEPSPSTIKSVTGCGSRPPG
jgi:hypothetical protein